VACGMFAPGRGGEEDGWEERFHVEFGSAPFSLVKTVCEDIRAAYNIDDDVDISYQRLWDDSDIWVYVPWRFHANLGLQLPSSSAGLDDELDSWVAPSSEGIQRSFIEMMEEEE